MIRLEDFGGASSDRSPLDHSALVGRFGSARDLWTRRCANDPDLGQRLPRRSWFAVYESRFPAILAASSITLHLLQGFFMPSRPIVWRTGSTIRAARIFAFYLQSRSSAVFQTDINPAAKIGRGIFLDHATGFVCGETAVVRR